MSDTRSKLLALLRSQPAEGFLSGQQAAEALGVSRAAVCKAAAGLRRQGYQIQAVTRRGYRLASEDAPLTRDGLLAALENWQAPVEVWPSLPSTNLRARQLALDGAPAGTVVAALCQTQGRGRFGRVFESPPGGLYLSMVLRPEGSIAQALTLTAAAAVAVCLPALARQAAEFAQQQGACFLDHLSSDDNPEFHRRVTGPALLRGMETEPDYVVVGVGTGGTITGVGEYCKARSQARVVAVEPYESPVLEGGFGGRHSIPGIGLGFVPPSYNPYVVDLVLAVSSGEARQTARLLLLTEGLPACPSAGAAAAAACRLLEEAPGSRVACIFAGTEPLLEQE